MIISLRFYSTNIHSTVPCYGTYKPHYQTQVRRGGPEVLARPHSWPGSAKSVSSQHVPWPDPTLPHTAAPGHQASQVHRLPPAPASAAAGRSARSHTNTSQDCRQQAAEAFLQLSLCFVGFCYNFLHLLKNQLKNNLQHYKCNV